MDYSMRDLMNGASIIQKSVFGKKSEYELKFNHEADGCWYVDFPGWPFDHHNLMMVSGADDLCALLSDDGVETRVKVIPASKQESHEGYAELRRLDHSLTGGAHYEVRGIEGFTRTIWLCPVTLFVLGQYPAYIYLKKNAPEKASTDEAAAGAGEVMDVYHLIVLDESGSMSCVTHQTITGCNETIQSIRSMQAANPDTQAHYVSIYLFDSGHSRYIIQNKPVAEVREITAEDYRPNACTPLFDAVGLTLTDLQARLEKRNSLGYVTIITDGMENASRRFSLERVRALISQLKKRNVVFTFIGANIDAEGYAADLGIRNSMQFTQDDAGMKEMWARDRRSKMRSMAKMSYMMKTAEDFDLCGYATCANAGDYYALEVDKSRISDDKITDLREGEIFVFGSNAFGNHTGGAAAMAVARFGAVMGQAEGLQGRSYAIPTAGVTLEQLDAAVERFCAFAAEHPELTFLVTAVGCGAAKWSAYDVAPMFQKAAALKNVKLPRSFCDFIDF